MIGLPLAFTAPLVLAGLIVLPVLWWLLRLTPPRPRRETFPPTRLLLEIAPKEEMPARSPWWLTLLRLLMAALVIFALAGPILRPVTEGPPGAGPLLVVIDNGWAAAPGWEETVATARDLVRRAGDDGRPVALVATADGLDQPLEPDEAGKVLARLEALEPRPFPTTRAALRQPLAAIASTRRFGGAAWLSDGLGGEDAKSMGELLGGAVEGPVALYGTGSTARALVALKPPEGTAESLSVPVIRRSPAGQAGGIVRAQDLKGRVIGEATFAFETGAPATTATFDLPAELRNEIVRLDIAGEQTAGAVQLLDERWRRRRVGLLSGASAEAAQPLLSPLYYISRAVTPFADVREPHEANIARAVPDVIEAGSSVIAMADIGTLPAELAGDIRSWVERGGTLVRFAGPRLAAAGDDLLPVRLRRGDRTLGGSLTWETPQPLASFMPNSPFANIAVPDDVVVNRQILAEPDGDLADKTWAALADGTPLVTASRVGQGWIVLFHVTADTGWSNLALSGTFVEMLRAILANARVVTGATGANASPQPLPPLRLLDGYGRFAAPGAGAEPLPAGAADIAVDAVHPPGLYGAEEGFRALSLLDREARLEPLDASILSGAERRSYPGEAPQDLRPPLFAAALILFLLDILAVLWLAGAMRGLRRPAVATAIAFALGGAALLLPRPAAADELTDRFALDAANETRLAYVVTGNPEIDEASKLGLAGLTRVLGQRTALEAAAPMGVDVSRDELAFFPLLYWPIDPSRPMPDSATMARVDAFMKQGGSILFDTRDELERSTQYGFTGTPAAERLRAMLENLDIPPLDPVPADHVLTKAFYLLNDFPGRFTGGPLWVESIGIGNGNTSDRPARAGDGVSSILITSNDFAGAWASDANGKPVYATVPADPLQREMAFRGGVNIVMYTLTGNYKADQVHVPALLERLGQ